MPNYTGTIALILGIVVQMLGVFGVKLPDDFTGQATQAIVAVISAVTMLVGLWRLLHTKKVADVATAQVIASGQQPIVGPKADTPITESDRLNAQQLVRKAASK